jgi:hypothetical protein
MKIPDEALEAVTLERPHVSTGLVAPGFQAMDARSSMSCQESIRRAARCCRCPGWICENRSVQFGSLQISRARSLASSVTSSEEAAVDRRTIESPERVTNTLFIVFPNGANGDWGAILESLLDVVVLRIRHESFEPGRQGAACPQAPSIVCCGSDFMYAQARSPETGACEKGDHRQKNS